MANFVRIPVSRWAPTRRRAELIIDPQGPARRSVRLRPDSDGMWSATIDDVSAGDRYACLLDGHGPYSEAASRFQPDGVHAPSALVDAGLFDWSDHAWRGVALDRSVPYEIHVGTFTPAGTALDTAD
jgi:maltooligosyltrehalose trehalohydrolase